MSLGSKKVFFPNLDGLRFLCFLSVFFFHSFHTKFDTIKNTGTYTFVKHGLFGNGNIGVNFFFVLSGFLITYLLIEEKNIHNKIDLPKFWLRRILRIWPLYFFCVIFGFFIFPQIKLFFGETPNESATLFSYLTFTSNFEIISKGLPDSSILGVLWSIAIEEQFYLFWPVLLILVPEKYYIHFFLLIIFSSWAYRYFYPGEMTHEYHTLSCIGDLTIGALGACLCRRPTLRTKLEHLGKGSILIIYLCFFICYFFRKQLFFDNPLQIAERSIISFFILMIILEQNFSRNSFFKFSDFKRISKLGTISYGLYCLHFIGILIAITLTQKLRLNDQLWEVLFLETAIALVVSIILSRISYRFLESPLLKIKEKFAYITK